MQTKIIHKLIRLERALTNGKVARPQAGILEMLIYDFNKAEGDDIVQMHYWRMIQGICKSSPTLQNTMNGRLPHSVRAIIHTTAQLAQEEYYQCCINIHRNLGFLPISVNVAECGDMHYVAQDAAKRMSSSIVRKLTKAYKSGGWDGELRSAPMFFNQPVLDAPDFSGVFE